MTAETTNEVFRLGGYVARDFSGQRSWTGRIVEINAIYLRVQNIDGTHETITKPDDQDSLIAWILAEQLRLDFRIRPATADEIATYEAQI